METLERRSLTDKDMWQANILVCPACEAKIRNRYGPEENCDCGPEKQKQALNSMISPGGVFFDCVEVKKVLGKVVVLP